MRTPYLAAALALGCLWFSRPAAAQEYLGVRDFLTTHETDLIREAQDPNLRIETYLEFAALRIELVRQLLEEEEAGRGAKIHRNLEEYGRILEAIDMVIDDALVREIELTETIPLMIGRQKAFLAALERVDESDPDDLWRYEFVLFDAIEITEDSLELAAEDLGERKDRVLASDEAERAARDKKMSVERRRDVAKTREKAAKREEASRGPSLLKQGETLDEANDAIPKKRDKK